MFAEERIGEQFVNELSPFVGVPAVQEGGHFSGGRDDAGNIEIDAADELGVFGPWRRRDLLGVQALLNRHVDAGGQGNRVELDGGKDVRLGRSGRRFLLCGVRIVQATRRQDRQGQ